MISVQFIIFEKLLASRSNVRTLVQMDETNFNLYCRRGEGSSKICARATVVLPASQSANLHCIAAMTSIKMVLITARRSAFKSQDCCAWLRKLIDACAANGIQRPTLIVDKALPMPNYTTCWQNMTMRNCSVWVSGSKRSKRRSWYEFGW